MCINFIVEKINLVRFGDNHLKIVKHTYRSFFCRLFVHKKAWEENLKTASLFSLFLIILCYDYAIHMCIYRKIQYFHFSPFMYYVYRFFSCPICLFRLCSIDCKLFLWIISYESLHYDIIKKMCIYKIATNWLSSLNNEKKGSILPLY